MVEGPAEPEKTKVLSVQGEFGVFGEGHILSQIKALQTVVFTAILIH